MKHTYASDLDQTNLRLRLESCFRRCAEKYAAHNFECFWKSKNEACLALRTALGRVHGTAILEEGRVEFDVALPLAMRPISGRVRGLIDAELAEG